MDEKSENLAQLKEFTPPEESIVEVHVISDDVGSDQGQGVRLVSVFVPVCPLLEGQEDHQLEPISVKEGGNTSNQAVKVVVQSEYLESIAAAVKSKRRAASRNIKNIVQQQICSKTFSTKSVESEKYEIEVKPENATELPASDTVDDEMFPENRCANCLHIFEDGEVRISDVGSDAVNISVREALCSIFRFPKRDDSDSHGLLLLLCRTCSQSLSTLYLAFKEFMELTNETSFVMLKLNEELTKLRKKKAGRKVTRSDEYQKSPDEPPSEEEEVGETITGDISSDEDFQASPSDLAAVGFESSSSSSGDDDYVPHKKSKCPKATRMRKQLDNDNAINNNSDILEDDFMENRDTRKSRTISKDKKTQKRRSVFGDLTYKCSTCGTDFLRPRDLRIHLRELHRPGVLPQVKSISPSTQTYSCQHCSQDFETFDSLSQHLLSQHQLQHVENNQDQKSHSCQTCKTSFEDVASLRSHEILHKVEKPYKCIKCQLSFRRADVLRVHFRNEHEDNGKDDEVSPRKQANAKLKKAKLGRVIVPCEICGKSFVRQDQLKQHLRVHTGERPFVCKICGKAFGDPRGLSYHEVTHSSDRKYCCTVCGMTFKRLHHLNDHEKNHREDVERPFACEYCSKTFKHRKHLNTHLLTHGSSKDHQCEICSKAFTRKDNLRQHVRKVHGKEFQEGSAFVEQGETLTMIPVSINATTDIPTIITPGIQLETVNLDRIEYIDL